MLESISFYLTIFDSAIRLSVPLVCACLAGLMTERSGTINIALEGLMLGSAFAAAAAAFYFNSAWIGVLFGILTSIAFSMVHGFATITQRGNQVVSGVAINLLATGLTVQLGAIWFHQGGRTPGLTGNARFYEIQFPFAESLNDVPLLGQIYSQVLSGHDVIVYIAYLCVPLVWWLLNYTTFGLRLRAVGENPHSVDTGGISVALLRYQALVICGVLAGLGGASLSVAQNAGFIENMTAGKGFIALAALVFANWRPWRALATCFLFGLLDAVAIRMQGTVIAGIGQIPVQFIQALPYVFTIILLAGFIGRSVPPKALGIPYVKDR